MSNSEQFQPGDVVQLKSGGPKMTVRGKNIRGDLICMWFVSDEDKEATFPAESLKKPEPTVPFA